MRQVVELHPPTLVVFGVGFGIPLVFHLCFLVMDGSFLTGPGMSSDGSRHGDLPSETGQGRVFRRGQGVAEGERILVVDDVLTTGGSVRDVLDAVRRLGGEVVGVGVLLDRSEGAVDFGVPFYSCHRLSIPTFPPHDCPLCRKGIPLERPGGA